jgi:hypothetical protein
LKISGYRGPVCIRPVHPDPPAAATENPRPA